MAAAAQMGNLATKIDEEDMGDISVAGDSYNVTQQPQQASASGMMPAIIAAITSAGLIGSGLGFGIPLLAKALQDNPQPVTPAVVDSDTITDVNAGFGEPMKR